MDMSGPITTNTGMSSISIGSVIANVFLANLLQLNVDSHTSVGHCVHSAHCSLYVVCAKALVVRIAWGEVKMKFGLTPCSIC